MCTIWCHLEIKLWKNYFVEMKKWSLNEKQIVILFYTSLGYPALPGMI